MFHVYYVLRPSMILTTFVYYNVFFHDMAYIMKLSLKDYYWFYHNQRGEHLIYILDFLEIYHITYNYDYLFL